MNLESRKLESLHLSTEMMDAYQISSFVQNVISAYTYECTKFDVLALDNAISAGTIIKDNEFLSKNSSKLSENDVVKVDMLAGKTHSLRMRGHVPSNEADVVVDWGDGNVSAVNELNLNKGADSTYDIRHTYENQGIYTITIYGKDYYQIGNAGDANNPNIGFNAFDASHPIATCVESIQGLFKNSDRIVQIFFGKNKFFRNIVNWYDVFNGCKNLLVAEADDGKDMFFNYIKSTEQMFMNCTNLRKSNVQLPRYGSAFSMYSGCSSLDVDLFNLFPTSGFTGVSRIIAAFKNCSSLTLSESNVSKLAQLTWNSINPVSYRSGTWKYWETSEIFKYVSEDARKLIPESWGGLKNDTAVMSYDDIRETVTGYMPYFYKNDAFDLLISKQYGTVLYFDMTIPENKKIVKFARAVKHDEGKDIVAYGKNMIPISLTGCTIDNLISVEANTHICIDNIDGFSFNQDPTNGCIVKVYSDIETFGETVQSGSTNWCGFFNQRKLKSVIMPNLKEAGYRAFQWNYELHDVYLPNVEKICEFAFSSCIKLEKLDLPKAFEIFTTKIALDNFHPFKGCSKLIELNLPSMDVDTIFEKDRMFNDSLTGKAAKDQQGVYLMPTQTVVNCAEGWKIIYNSNEDIWEKVR